MDNYDHYDSKDSVSIGKRKISDDDGCLISLIFVCKKSNSCYCIYKVIAIYSTIVSNMLAGERRYRSVGIILHDDPSSSQTGRILQQCDSQYAGDRGSRSMPGSKHRYFYGDSALRSQ